MAPVCTTVRHVDTEKRDPLTEIVLIKDVGKLWAVLCKALRKSELFPSPNPYQISMLTSS